jgi:hypothetical protein
LIGLAAAERHAGHLVEAAGFARRGLAFARQGEFLVHEGAALTVLAAIERDRGRPGPARARAHRALTIQSRTGDHVGQVDAKTIMAELGERPP